MLVGVLVDYVGCCGRLSYSVGLVGWLVSWFRSCVSCLCSFVYLVELVGLRG